MIPCPKCGNFDYREGRCCPQYDGKPVCIRCCRECGYYNPSPMGLHCRYYIYNPRPDYDGEIDKLRRQIEIKERQAEHFYRDNKPWIAEKIEREVSWLRGQKREWERKRDEETKKAGNDI
ncbi:hypothetical protein D1155_08030 [Anaerotruncus sp. 80]|uniref:Uncharacterized protein n=1 Tax=Anaerotruncus colihominis TaxID=169435 RepID=A0A845QKL2_9FIRM|nr:MULTISPECIES: hypothetical protein [Anaerotruncus]NBH61595.1 hypothetical protein [Anaerotruncus colihominis]NCF02250.1 hypothetical protein [Anaerotruncus sp. 80]